MYSSCFPNFTGAQLQKQEGQLMLFFCFENEKSQQWNLPGKNAFFPWKISLPTSNAARQVRAAHQWSEKGPLHMFKCAYLLLCNLHFLNGALPMETGCLVYAEFSKHFIFCEYERRWNQHNGYFSACEVYSMHKTRFLAKGILTATIHLHHISLFFQQQKLQHEWVTFPFFILTCPGQMPHSNGLFDRASHMSD